MPACLPRALGGWPGYWLQIALILALRAAMALPGLNVLAKLAHSTNAPMQHEQYFCFACFCFLFAQQCCQSYDLKCFLPVCCCPFRQH
jgi:hypothetical protein